MVREKGLLESKEGSTFTLPFEFVCACIVSRVVNEVFKHHNMIPWAIVYLATISLCVRNVFTVSYTHLTLPTICSV